MVKLIFVSLKGQSYNLDLSGQFNADEVSSKLCKQMNVENQRFLYFINNYTISTNYTCEELAKMYCPIVFKKNPAVTQRPKNDVPSGISDLKVAIDQSMKNTTVTKPDVYNTYENVIAREKKRSRNDPPNMAELVSKLTSAGFAKEDVIKALRRRNYNPEQAIELLLPGNENAIQIPLVFRLLLDEESLNKIQMMIKREDIPKPNTPYARHFNEESFMTEDSTYSPANERSAREKIRKLENSIEEDNQNYEEARARLTADYDEEDSELHKAKLQRDLREIDRKHQNRQESIQRDLDRERRRLDRILAAKREAQIVDEPPPPPVLRRPRVSPELQDSLNSLNDDEVRNLMDLRGAPFDEVLQMYILFEKNLEQVRLTLGI